MPAWATMRSAPCRATRRRGPRPAGRGDGPSGAVSRSRVDPAGRVALPAGRDGRAHRRTRRCRRPLHTATRPRADRAPSTSRRGTATVRAVGPHAGAGDRPLRYRARSCEIDRARRRRTWQPSAPTAHGIALCPAGMVTTFADRTLQYAGADAGAADAVGDLVHEQVGLLVHRHAAVRLGLAVVLGVEPGRTDDVHPRLLRRLAQEQAASRSRSIGVASTTVAMPSALGRDAGCDAASTSRSRHSTTAADSGGRLTERQADRARA